MKAADVMTRPVITVPVEASLIEALHLMVARGVSGLPVIDGRGEIVGIITEGDLLRRAETSTEKKVPWWKSVLLGSERMTRDYIHTHARSVSSIMTRSVHCVHENTSLERVVEIMEEAHVKRVPVLRSQQVVGIVSRRDLLRHLLSLLDQPSSSSGSDAEIARLINKTLAEQSWAPRQTLRITVNHGIVELAGVAFGEGERDALKVLVQNVPGVKELHDQLIVLDPLCGVPIERTGG